MIQKILPILIAATLAPTALADFQVTQAHALASVIIENGPAVLDEDWDMPLQVSAFAGGQQGIGSSTGASFDFAGGFNGMATAQATSYTAESILSAGTMLDFTFVIDGDVTASLCVNMMLISNGDAFGVVDFLLMDITQNLSLVDIQQTTGSTSMISSVDLLEGHTYQLTAQAEADVNGQDAATSMATLSFELLIPAPGALALLAMGIALPMRRRRR
jgi:hypothetical protein